MFGMSDRQCILATLSMISFVSVISSTADAQQQQQFKNPYQKKKPAPPLPSATLNTPVEIPDVPQFSGQSKFQTGAVEDEPTSIRYREYWLVKEDQPQVVEWYKNALMNYQWKVKSVTFDRVAATKEKSNVEVMVLKYPVPKDGFRCQLLVRSTKMK